MARREYAVPHDQGMEAAAPQEASGRFPGPVALAAWLAVTVTAPLWYYASSRPVETWPPASGVFWWTVAALPVMAAVAAARWTASSSRPNLGSAVGVGTLVAAGYLLLSLAMYWWIIPLRDSVGGWALCALAIAVPGAGVGHLLGQQGIGRPGDRAGAGMRSVRLSPYAARSSPLRL